MSPKETVAQRRDEFEAHIWNHSIDPFQASFDFRRPLSDPELAGLRRVVEAVAQGQTDDELATAIKREAIKNEDVMFILMQLAGLTRNKILNDLKAATAAQRISIPSSARLLPRRPEAWRLAGPYLAKWLRGVFEPIATQTSDDLDGALEALNQATWPGWIRQERAKRQGHEAEHRLAVLFAGLGLSYAPLEKADNPLCPDVQVHGVSFDLVVPNVLKFGLCVKSTVQTSNIGQFGESKGALEIIEAADMLTSEFLGKNRPLLLAMVDGVGFRSNRAGLDGILEHTDEFCQFATVWKAAVLAARADNVKIEVHLPEGDADRHRAFLERHSVAVGVLDDSTRATLIAADAVEAGEALVSRRR